MTVWLLMVKLALPQPEPVMVFQLQEDCLTVAKQVGGTCKPLWHPSRYRQVAL